MRLCLLIILVICAFLTSINAQNGDCTTEESGQLLVMPPLPAAGGNYPGGTVVDMCFVLSEFNTPGINWLHTIIPQLGPAFDLSTFVVTSLPTSCSGSGAWGYYDSWVSCNLGLTYGPGFSFDSNSGVGCGGAANDGDPGNNWGDGGTLCANRRWCWQVTTVPVSPFSCNVINYNTRIFVFGDGEAGSWTNSPCLNDPPLCWPELENFTIVEQPSPCGCSMLSATWDGQVLFADCGFEYRWTGPNGFMSNDLNIEACDAGTYNLSVRINGCNDYSGSITINPTGAQAMITATASPTSVCAGDQITFSASGLGVGGTYTWTIEGSTYQGATVTVTVNNPGAAQAMVSGFTAIGCDAENSVFYVVIQRPTAIIQNSDDQVCVEDHVTISSFAAGMVSWDFGNAIVNSGSNQGPYDISFPAAGSYPITLIASNSVCADTNTVIIEVFDTLPPPEISCMLIGSDSIVFVWEGVDGVVEYELSVNSGAVFTTTDTTYGVGQLINGSNITLEVRSLGNGICPDAGPSSATCGVFNCPTSDLNITTPADSFCLTGSNDSIPLTFSISGAGNLIDTTWSGNGVIGADFYPDLAGLGQHQVFLSITNDSSCTYRDTVFFEVFPLPTADFTVIDTICIDATSTVTYTGSADPTSTSFNWDFDGATIVSGTGGGPYELSWPVAGDYTITLAVEDENCASTEVQMNVTVIDLLPVPMPGCGGGTVDSVSFNWPDVAGATAYVISLNGGPDTTITGTSIGLGGLAEGEMVTLTIYALGEAPCGDSDSTTLICIAEACPELTVLIDTTQSAFCLGAAPDFIVLGISQNSGSGTGVYAWSGPGVSNDTFYVANAGLGNHEIIMSYEEGLCSYGDTTTFTVSEIPNANFILSENLICVDEVIMATTEVAMLPGASYEWDFNGGTATPGTGAGPHDISWPAAGVYTVSLVVTANGCSDTTSAAVTVEDSLTVPVLICGNSSLTTTEVNWGTIDPNVGYEVSINGMVVDTVNVLTYVVSNLSPDSTVTISVRALGDGPCGDGPSADIDCASNPCPDITLTVAADTTNFCLDGGTSPVELMATSSGGDMSGTFVWTGAGVSQTGNTYFFDPVLAGLGNHLLIVNYVETAGCGATDTLIMNVYEVPTAAFTAVGTNICLTETSTVTYSGSAGPNAVLVWNFDGAAVTDLGSESYELSWPAAGIYVIGLSVIDNGCSSNASVQVNVSDTLVAAQPTCINQTLTSVTFEWVAVTGALGYIVQYGGVTDTITDLDLVISGLTPGELATLTITPLGPLPCGDGPSNTVACAAANCPVITLTPMAGDTAFCLDGMTTPTPLSATSSGGDMTGTFTWNGPGVTMAGTDFFFDPVLAGLGTHMLTVDYVETAGCDTSATLTVHVYEVPTAAFNTSSTSLCIGQQTTVDYAGNASSNATFVWDFDGATAIPLGGESYDLSWPAAGAYVISLTVTDNGCTSSASVQINVSAPLATPEPFCSSSTLTSVTFEWPAVAGATTYLVSINNGPPFVVNGTTYTEGGLTESEVVTITIIAQGPAPCGDSEMGTESCQSDPCLTIDLEPSAAQTAFCTDMANSPVALELTTNGGMGGGDIVWTGTGVEADGSGGFQFNPTGLSPGNYSLMVTYTESICSYSGTISMDVNPTPVAQISVSQNNVCEATTVSVSFSGTAGAGAVYEWDFDGATVTDLGNENYELSWTNSGAYTISLTVSQAGCMTTNSMDVTVAEPPVAGQQIQPLAVCPNNGEVIELSALLGGADAGGVWSPAPGSPATVDVGTGQLNTFNLAAGTYQYLYTVEGGVCTDAVATVELTIQPSPVANAGAGQLLTCNMGMVSLNGSASSGIGNLTYTWTGPDGQEVANDGNSSMVDVSQPGTYTLTVTSDIGCSATAQVLVEAETEVPVPQVEINNISCFSGADGTILVTDVDGGRPPYTYSLNDGPAGGTTFFTGLNQGEYMLRVTDANGCFTEIFLGIDRPDQLTVSISLPDDQNQYNEGDRVTMTANVSGGNTIDTILWQPDSLNRVGEGSSNTITFLADETRTISVTVIDENGCRANDQTTILVRRDRPVFIPSGFSPNGDNVNDILFIGANNDQVVNIQQFLVFNRWGESVFENYNFQPNEPVQGWDGTHRGESMNPAVFVYVAVVEFINGEVVTFKGDVTLLR